MPPPLRRQLGSEHDGEHLPNALFLSNRPRPAKPCTPVHSDTASRSRDAFRLPPNRVFESLPELWYAR